MVDEILKLWDAYNFCAELPENLPDEIAYKVLVDHFDKPVEWVSEGTLHIEFCDYDPERCPFPKNFVRVKILITKVMTKPSTLPASVGFRKIMNCHFKSKHTK